MAKVSIALRGWRFDEAEVFDETGELRPLDELPEETRKRLVRLKFIADEPCNVCWLLHRDESECNTAEIVYGEPLNEVLLCNEHEADFLYWFREDVGKLAKGQDDFADLFHEWYAAGNRAPDGYGGVEHVDTEPDAVPKPRGAEDTSELDDAVDELDEDALGELGMDYSDIS